MIDVWDSIDAAIGQGHDDYYRLVLFYRDMIDIKHIMLV